MSEVREWNLLKQIENARKEVRAHWRIKSMRPILFPHWYALVCEERELVARLKKVREQKKAIDYELSRKRNKEGK